MYRPFQQKQKDKALLARQLQRKRFLELFPRINRDSFANNHQIFRERLESFDQTPQNIRLTNRFEKANTLESNDESLSTVSKQTDRFRSRVKSPYKLAFAYQSVATPEIRSNSLNARIKYQIANKQRVITEPHEEMNAIFGQIEQNLSECDKILLKLKGLGNHQKPHRSRRKMISVQWNREVEMPSSMSFAHESKELQGNYAQIQRKRNNQYQREGADTQYINLSQHQSMHNSSLPAREHKSRTIQPFEREEERKANNESRLSQKSVFELRKRRIVEIINNNKSKVEDPLQLSFGRLKQRGETLFSKVLRNKQIVSGREIYYQSSMPEAKIHQ